MKNVKSQITIGVFAMIGTFLGCANGGTRELKPSNVAYFNGAAIALKIEFGENQIHYHFTVLPESFENCNARGLAKAKNTDGDTDIDIDDNGTAYPSREYQSGKKCLLSFRIEELYGEGRSGPGSRLVFTRYNCKANRVDCKPSNDVVLRRGEK